MEPIRLQKYFTDCGVLSRRAAEEAIRAGEVAVNGTVATIGMRVDPDVDSVTYRGRPVARQGEERHYILLHKPRGFVTTLSDEKGRHTVAELVADVGCRLYPVGRLDMDSDGLLLMTDDGELANRLTHPKHEIPKHYRVTVRGMVTEAQLQRLSASFLLDGYKTLPVKVERLSTGDTGTLLSFALYEGRNRQIRRMCEEVGLAITQLTRVGIGNIGIGNLPVGHHRSLTPAEIAYLKGEKT